MTERRIGKATGPLRSGMAIAAYHDLEARFFEAMRQLSEQKESILKAFLAETGLMPSECEIMQVTEGTTIRWFVRKRQDA